MFTQTQTRIVATLTMMLLTFGLFFGFAAPAFAADTAADAKALLGKLEAVEGAVKAGDFAAAAAAYKQYDASWLEREDSIKGASKEQYRVVEDAAYDLKSALAAKDAKLALAAVASMEAGFQKVVADPNPAVAPRTAGKATLIQFMAMIGEGQTAIGRNDATATAAALTEMNKMWLDVELEVKPRSAEAYNATESSLAAAAAALRQNNLPAAGKAFAALNNTLAPIAERVSSPYGPLDAASIILREGLEAMLVVIALVAFLKKSGNEDKRHWIWLGGAFAVVASLLTAFALQVLFSSAAGGSSRELVEGVVGLLAAAMLFYVSYWLHSKSSVAGWQAYIRNHSSAALAGGSLFSLALLAFLAVYREGAETTLFYMGMAPSISVSDLVLGLVIGTVGLVAIGLAMTVFGLRIPMHTFFRVSSFLIYYIGFKFVGTGIHGLQMAGVLPNTTIQGIPSGGLLEFFGIYPTVETMIGQGMLLVAGVTVWVLSTRRQVRLARQMKMEQATA